MNLLIADDDEIFRERLARSFRSRGFEVRAAADGLAAIEMARAQPPSMAVIDLRMPGASGLEVLKEFLALNPLTRVLLLTGYGSIANAVEAMKHGAAGYLPKPADANEILAALLPDEARQEESAEAPTLARAEWEHIQRVLADCEGNVSEAARRLGLHRQSLQRKLRKHPPSR